MSLSLLPDFLINNYEVHEWKHACAILTQDFPFEWQDIIEALTNFRLKKQWISIGGGRKSEVAQSLDNALYNKGWTEKLFRTQVVVDKQTVDSPTHKVDCYKNRVALEIEWNNKDPFFDRDLNNFRMPIRTVPVIGEKDVVDSFEESHYAIPTHEIL